MTPNGLSSSKSNASAALRRRVTLAGSRVWEYLSRASTRWVALVWLASRAALTAGGAIVWILTRGLFPRLSTFYYDISPITDGPAGALLGIWQRWDAIHYQRIAQAGYTTDQTTAFFPLYPLLGRLAGMLFGGNALLGLMVVSNLALLAALLALFPLLERRFSTDFARQAVLIALALPGSFFFYAAYPQSLILLFSVLVYRFSLEKRWLAAALSGLAAGLTHSTALPLVVLAAAYAWPAWWKERSGRSLPLLLVPFTPVLGIALFLAWRIHMGYPDYTALQVKLWEYEMVPVWEIFSRFKGIGWYMVNYWINLFLLLLSFWLAWLVWKKDGWQPAVYLLAAALFLGMGTNHGVPAASYLRYILAVFPLFPGLVWWAGRRFPLMLNVSIAAQALLLVYYFLWLWVA